MRDVPYGYCHCGCGQKTGISPQSHTARGYVRGEPCRFLSGHHGRKTPDPYECVDRGYMTPCWVWLRYRNPGGYGTVGHDGASRLAHVVEWEKVHGPVPDGLELDHLCCVRECVNPAHMEAVTHAENVRRGRSAKLTFADVLHIRASSETARVMAVRFGVSMNSIHDIRQGRKWRNAA